MPIAIILAFAALYLFSGDHLQEFEDWIGGHGDSADKTPAAGPSVTPPPLPSAYMRTGNFGLGLESVIQQRTGVPVAAIGQAAIKAPTWAKVIFPVSLIGTAAAQKVIEHPVDTAKKVGSAFKSGAEKVGSGIEHAASGAYHEFTSLF
jgi:hypothetical protein